VGELEPALYESLVADELAARLEALERLTPARAIGRSHTGTALQ
jgi:hypothetical protein